MKKKENDQENSISATYIKKNRMKYLSRIFFKRECVKKVSTHSL